MSRSGKTEYGAEGGRRRKTGWLRSVPAVLWMAAIFWMSSRTGSEIGAMFPFVRYLPDWMGGLDFGHLAAYFVLGFLVLWAFGHTGRSAKWLTVVICTLYGATDEFHQLFVDGRSAQWHDLLNDAIGATLAVLLFSWPPVRRRIGLAAGKRPMG